MATKKDTAKKLDADKSALPEKKISPKSKKDEDDDLDDDLDDEKPAKKSKMGSLSLWCVL